LGRAGKDALSSFGLTEPNSLASAAADRASVLSIIRSNEIAIYSSKRRLAEDRAEINRNPGPCHPAATTTTGGTGSYHYKVTIAGTGTGDSFAVQGGFPLPQPTYTGSMSASFSLTFLMVFTVDAKAHTVAAAEPPATASAAGTNGSGTDSFMLTSVQGSQTNSCTIPANSKFTIAGGLSPVWGGGPDKKSYSTGEMLFYLSAATNSSIYPCSPSTIGTMTIDKLSVPGLTMVSVNSPASQNPAVDPYPGCVSGGSVDIPIAVSELGNKHVKTTFDPGPVACQSTHLSAQYTAHVKYTITLDLQSTS
jgi:hypothetical protein